MRRDVVFSKPSSASWIEGISFKGGESTLTSTHTRLSKLQYQMWPRLVQGHRLLLKSKPNKTDLAGVSTRYRHRPSCHLASRNCQKWTRHTDRLGLRRGNPPSSCQECHRLWVGFWRFGGSQSWFVTENEKNFQFTIYLKMLPGWAAYLIEPFESRWSGDNWTVYLLLKRFHVFSIRFASFLFYFGGRVTNLATVELDYVDGLFEVLQSFFGSKFAVLLVGPLSFGTSCGAIKLVNFSLLRLFRQNRRNCKKANTYSK